MEKMEKSVFNACKINEPSKPSYLTCRNDIMTYSSVLGTFSGEGALFCAPCPTGYTCDNPADDPVPCLPGYYWSNSDAVSRALVLLFHCFIRPVIYNPRQCVDKKNIDIDNFVNFHNVIFCINDLI